MNTDIYRLVFVVPDRRAASEVAVPEEWDTQESLAVNVLFTTEKHASSALRVAGALALNLHAHLNLVVIKEVPLAFPLDRPPVAVPFTVRRLHDFARRGIQGRLDTTVWLYYCRDKLQGLLQALKPKSLVIIGGEKNFWPSKESRLARKLRAQGHQIIFPTDN